MKTLHGELDDGLHFHATEFNKHVQINPTTLVIALQQKTAVCLIDYTGGLSDSSYI